MDGLAGMFKAPGRLERSRLGRRDLLLFSLLLLGLLVSGILAYAKMTNRTGLCIGSTAVCDKIQNSPQAYFLGIPVAYLGNHTYMVLLCLWLVQSWGSDRARSIAAKTFFGIALFAALFSGYLMYVQLFVLGGICPLCVSSAAFITLLAVLSGLELLVGGKGGDWAVPAESTRAQRSWASLPRGPGLLLALMGALTVVVMIVSAVGLWAAILTTQVRDLREDVAVLKEFGLGGDPNAPRQYGAVPGKKYAVSIGDSPSLGPAEAPVTIVEFSSFKCSYCAFLLPTFKKIRENFPDEVRIVYKHYPPPLDREAMVAHRAAAAAMEQGKFWEMHDLLFEEAGPWDEDEVLKLAGGIGLELERFRESMESERIKVAIAADQEQGGDLEILGSPVFFINGEYVVGRQPYRFFESKIKEILEGGKDRARPE